ncbi:hypothetical protein BVY04_05275 [bacterium M21]|nr:hypothetical protein BVY04_05275 [bacterium M21]
MLNFDQNKVSKKRRRRRAPDPIPFNADPALKPSWGLLVFACALIVLPVWGIADARNYFQDYFSSPRAIEKAELAGVKAGDELVGKRIEVDLPPLKESGIHTVLLESWGDSQLERKVDTVNSVKLLPIGERYLVVLRQPGLDLGKVKGALVTIRKSLRQKLVLEYDLKNYADLFEPYCLDEMAYDTKAPYWFIVGAVLAILWGCYLVISEVKRIKQLQFRKKEEDHIIYDLFNSEG